MFDVLHNNNNLKICLTEALGLDLMDSHYFEKLSIEIFLITHGYVSIETLKSVYGMSKKPAFTRPAEIDRILWSYIEKKRPMEQ